jgi:hypothetical protein
MTPDELGRQCVPDHLRYGVLSAPKVELEVERKPLK